MDRLEAMSTVLAVAEAGSLSAAARRLRTPVATASRKRRRAGHHRTARRHTGRIGHAGRAGCSGAAGHRARGPRAADAGAPSTPPSW